LLLIRLVAFAGNVGSAPFSLFSDGFYHNCTEFMHGSNFDIGPVLSADTQCMSVQPMTNG